MEKYDQEERDWIPPPFLTDIQRDFLQPQRFKAL